MYPSLQIHREHDPRNPAEQCLTTDKYVLPVPVDVSDLSINRQRELGTDLSISAVLGKFNVRRLCVKCSIDCNSRRTEFRMQLQTCGY